MISPQAYLEASRPWPLLELRIPGFDRQEQYHGRSRPHGRLKIAYNTTHP